VCQSTKVCVFLLAIKNQFLDYPASLRDQLSASRPLIRWVSQDFHVDVGYWIVSLVFESEFWRFWICRINGVGGLTWRKVQCKRGLKFRHAKEWDNACGTAAIKQLSRSLSVSFRVHECECATCECIVTWRISKTYRNSYTHTLVSIAAALECVWVVFC